MIQIPSDSRLQPRQTQACDRRVIKLILSLTQGDGSQDGQGCFLPTVYLVSPTFAGLSGRNRGPKCARDTAGATGWGQVTIP